MISAFGAVWSLASVITSSQFGSSIILSKKKPKGIIVSIGTRKIKVL
jgi:hypothetical protein